MSSKLSKKARKNVMENLSAFSGYPIEGLQRIPLLDCKWNREIQISGCTGILEYDDQTIVLKTIRGNCGICGEGLYMENFHRDTLTVYGNLHTIWFGERRETDV